ncbi:DUF6797 domain-containing protein [Humisphaera borealis]|uniref:DUF6797 domain-containing protein n=1 Tax=Humisphaera borealis TaxID=2807512 RepID=A0A7M2WQH6_9BACT|nr:DUF6797 domain-containing protein [Humisphaera borealis]QOV87649.1 hypothetical protein IPV69_15290 [Humisphaera borealis]
MTARLLAAALIAAVFAGLSPFAAGQSVEGKFGRALKVGPVFASADHNPIYAVNPVTVELWARVNGRDSSILLSNEPRNSKTHWELYTEQETGRFAVGMPGYNPKSVISQTDISDDQWHYLVYQFDGKTVRLFVDGKLAAEAPVKMTAPHYNTGPLLFGYEVGVAAHGDTSIDDVRISRVLRDATKVPAAPFKRDADTVGLWHFDEDEKALAKAGGYGDDSAIGNIARLKKREEGVVDNGGFNNTVGNKTRWSDMDYGPFFSSTISNPSKSNTTFKAVSLQLGKDRKHFITFDTELLRMSAAWDGSFIKIPAGREGLSGPPTMGSTALLQTPVAPGWATGANADDWSDPRPQKSGSLPPSRGKYKGMFLQGEHVAFAYQVDGVDVVEATGVQIDQEFAIFRRTYEIAPSPLPMATTVCSVPDAKDRKEDGIVILESDGPSTFASAYGEGSLQSIGGRVVLKVEPHAKPVVIEVMLAAGDTSKLAQFKAAHKIQTQRNQNRSAYQPVMDTLRKGCPPRYPQPLITKGTLGKSDGPWAVDTLTAPDDNPWHSFLRFGGHDFFSNGDAAICSVSGDVWVVSGIDDKLEKLSWRRFATGLFQPLGLKIVDDKVYVLGRDQITKLHDFNADGEADFYENYNNDGIVTTNGHAYVACLERDAAGNFYYIKCGDRTPHGGTVLKVSPDGKTLSVHATGVRNANGLGMSPAGVVSFADNQGDWVPASRIDLITQPRQFLGYTPMSKTDTPPTDPGKPICWMPQNIDNSSGGQVWVQGNQWGLPAGTMLHTSYGAATLLQVMPQTLKAADGSEVTQAAVWKLPLAFSTGIMRGRFRPQDGQLYVSGLRGWQTAGTKDGAFQRVRYTGKPLHAPTAVAVHKNGIKLTFTDALDPETANDAGSYSILQWNYRWSAEYGSKHWSVKNPDAQGYDTVDVKSAKLLPDGRSVFLTIDGLKPVMQMRISVNIDCKDGETIKTDVYNTIHALAPEGP